MKKLPEVRIHPEADVSADAEIGDGTIIWNQAQVREGAKIGENCILGKAAYIDTGVRIGDKCKIQNGASVYRPAVIESGVLIGPSVIIANDPLPRAVNPDMSLKTEADYELEGVVIRQGASIGAGAIILPGITIGPWAMIGAGSVVTKNVLAHGLVIGNPAKLIGYVCSCGGRLQSMNNSSRRHICTQCKHQIFLIDAILT